MVLGDRWLPAFSGVGRFSASPRQDDRGGVSGWADAHAILATDLESGGAPMAGPDTIAGTEIRVDGGTHA
ncbi:hypothetical protein [Embleya sp. NPDC059237]|uniref:hypothetical protein n=1 Tax=Embleya sp. NPDC059237 TaxID=3346784 RepID=UPI003698A24E